MPGLVPGIHVFTTTQARRGWPGIGERKRRRPSAGYARPCRKRTLAIARSNDPTHRDPDRTDGDPDVVAAGRLDGGDRKNSGLSARGDDIRDRRAHRVHDLDRAAGGGPRLAAAATGVDRRRRRAVRLSRAVFPGAAFRTSPRSGPAELSLAAVDRAVLLAAARRAAFAASRHR